MKLALAVCSLVAFALIFQANPAQAGQSMLIYHGKNVVESPTEFAGTTFHFIIKNDKATMISYGQKGMEVIRMDIRPSEMCIQTVSTLCFDGIVTDVKNPQIHQIGDEVSLTIDFANKKQIGTAKTGPMQGMSVVMNIERMSLRSDAPYSISLSREGGFAALPPKTITYDSATQAMILTNNDSTLDVMLVDTMPQEIDRVVQKAKLLNITPEQYTPNPGAADYFSYSLQFNQGVFQKEFTWTDASDAPQSLTEIAQTLMFAAQPDQ